LTADKTKSCTEFKKKFRDVVHQSRFQVTFLVFFGKIEKIE
jgi:hypothetical protein